MSKIQALKTMIETAQSGDIEGAAEQLADLADQAALETAHDEAAANLRAADEALKTATMKPTVRKRKPRSLKCELTPDQMREYGERLAANQQRMTELQHEKADWDKAWKRRFAAVQSESDELGQAIRCKFELRDIECETASDYEKQTIHTVRLDNGETIEDRRMTNDELSQLPL